MTRIISILLLMLTMMLTKTSAAQAAVKADRPTLDHPACVGAKLASALVPVPITRSCDKDHDGVNDCRDRNPYQCSLYCSGLSGVDLDANMRMPVDQGDGTCARSNLANALIWKGAVTSGNDRPGEKYLDPRKPLPSGVLLFGAYRTRQFYVNIRIDYCDSALGDLTRCAQERDALQTRLAALESKSSAPTDTLATDTVPQAEYDLMVMAHAQSDALMQTIKQCHLKDGQRAEFKPDGTIACVTVAGVARGMAASDWDAVAVATAFALLFGFMLWKWWQDRAATQLARDNLRILRLSVKEILGQRQELADRLSTALAERDGARKALASVVDVSALLERERNEARTERDTQAARIVALTEQSRAESAPLLVTQAGELEAERGRIKMLTEQLRAQSEHVAALQLERDAAVAALEALGLTTKLKVNGNGGEGGDQLEREAVPPAEWPAAAHDLVGRMARMTGQLAQVKAQLADAAAENHALVKAEVGNGHGAQPPPPCGHEARITTLEDRVGRLETIEAAHQRMKPHQSALEAWRKHLRQHSRSKAPVQVAGLAALEVVIAELQATPATLAA